jgi:membrane protease YdiL (CAAX protease family)
MRKAASASLALGLSAAILSPSLQLATGSPIPYMLVLVALLALVWLTTPLQRKSLGFTVGGGRDHLIAASYPMVVMLTIGALALLSGQAEFSDWSVGKALKNMLLMGVATWIGVLITEEGFYRGALWGLSVRAGWRNLAVLGWTTLAFMMWHIGVPLVDPNYAVPAEQIPAWLINASLLGLTWGLLRLVSGSVLVACTAHAIWNGIAYIMFGYGDKTGVLTGHEVSLFDPERGILGLVMNTIMLFLFLAWARRRGFRLTDPA